jgi:MFS family permease
MIHMAAITHPPLAAINDRHEIFGWAMYDWANSAFSTTVITVFLGPYLASLAASAAEPFADGYARIGGLAIAPDSVLPYCVSISVFLQVFVLPILGAIADYSHIRKRMMQLFATIGAVATVLMFLVVSPDQWWFGGLLFIFANLAFGAAIVFYNAYLPDISKTSGGLLLRMGNGLPGGRAAPSAQSALLSVLRVIRHLDGAGRAHQPGVGWSVVAGILIHHLVPVALPPRAAQAAAR